MPESSVSGRPGQHLTWPYLQERPKLKSIWSGLHWSRSAHTHGSSEVISVSVVAAVVEEVVVVVIVVVVVVVEGGVVVVVVVVVVVGGGGGGGCVACAILSLDKKC